MPGLIDDLLKHITEPSPQDWVVQGGWAAAPATVIYAAADREIDHLGKQPYALKNRRGA